MSCLSLKRVIMRLHLWIKDVSLSEEKGFGLDPSSVIVEKFPLIVSPTAQIRLERKFVEQEDV